jgi:hypothetical protein
MVQGILLKNNSLKIDLTAGIADNVEKLSRRRLQHLF